MAQRLLLEGPDPEELVAQARRELGEGVEVVQSERVRSGGVLGFFSRESYAVTVEVPDHGAVDASGEAFARDQEDVDAARRELLGVPVSSSFASQLAEARTEGRGRGFVAAQFPTVAPPSPSAATPTVPVSAVPDGESVPSRAVQAAYRAGAASALTSALTAARATAAVHADAPPDDDQPVVPRDGGQAAMEAASVVAPLSPLPTATPPVQARPGSSPGASITVSATRETGVVMRQWDESAMASRPGLEGPSAGELLRHGLPQHMVDASRLDETVPWMDVMARLGVSRPPRLDAGDVVALVGDPADVVQVAFQVAAWSRTPLSDIVLAGTCPAMPGHGRRVTTEGSAARLRERADIAAEDGRPLIVAVGASHGMRAGAAAGALLAAMSADHVWSVVDAGRSEREREERVDHVGGVATVNGIALTGVARSHAPAAALGSAIPVVWLDGVPASSMAWVALLAERLAD